MFQYVHLVGTVCVFVAVPGSVRGLFTEVVIFKGKDECQRSCLSDPKCEMVVYSKLNITCHTTITARPPTDDEVHIKRSHIMGQSSHQPMKMKPFLDTCLVKHRNTRECIRDGIYACHAPSPDDWLLASSMCIPLHHFTVLYSCFSTWNGAGFTCQQTQAWEQLDSRRKKRKIIKKLQAMQLNWLPVPFTRSKIVRICGTPNTTTLFGLNFCLNDGSRILFHMNPRFYMYHPDRSFKNIVLMNHKLKNQWGYRPVHYKDFPFVNGQPFVLTCMRRKHYYVVKMDNHTWKYPDVPRRAPNRFFISEGLLDAQLQIF